MLQLHSFTELGVPDVQSRYDTVIMAQPAPAKTTARQRVHRPHPGRNLSAARRRDRETPRTHRALRRLGNLPLHHLHRRLRLLRPEGRPGDGGGDPHLHPRHRAGPPLRATLQRARKRHHHRHRRTGRVDRRGRHLHPARALHPQARPAPAPDHLHLRGRRLPGRPVPDPAAPLLRPRHARPACRTPKPPPSPRCWSPAKRAARKPSCCWRPPSSRASTISSSPPSRSGRNRSTSSSCPSSAPSTSAPESPSASTPSASSSASATSWACAVR